jgi:hypothetical protein
MNPDWYFYFKASASINEQIKLEINNYKTCYNLTAPEKETRNSQILIAKNVGKETSSET